MADAKEISCRYKTFVPRASLADQETGSLVVCNKRLIISRDTLLSIFMSRYSLEAPWSARWPNLLAPRLLLLPEPDHAILFAY